MKTDKCALFVWNKKGDCYQVSLEGIEQTMVLNLMQQLHKGSIKVGREKYPLELINKKNETKNKHQKVS